MDTLRSYSVRVAGSEYESTVIAHNAGAAKYQHFLAISDCYPGLRITDMRARSLDRLVEPPGFRECMKRRGIPFARVGMRVIVDGRPGAIVGHNDSANLDVLFDGDAHPSNCHPHWRVTYLDGDGKPIEPHPAPPAKGEGDSEDDNA